MKNKNVLRSGIIYAITNRIDGKKYIGQTIQSVEVRWYHHLYSARHGLRDTVLCRALKKHGEESFSIEVIDRADSIRELSALEQKYIAALNTIAPNGYNLTSGGLNHSVHPETRAKMSASGKGKHVFSAEALLKIGKASRGRVFSAEARAKMSVAHSVGRLSLETRAKLSVAGTGRVMSPEARAKLSASRKGMVFTQEHRENLSKAHKGKCLSAETKAKMSLFYTKRKWRAIGIAYSEITELKGD